VPLRVLPECANRRVTVDEAADILGITPGAVRNRISRSTLGSVREEGRVFVLLPADTPRDTHRDTTDLQSANDALISQLRSEIKYLREENQRKDHLLAAALERIPPQLEAPSEPRESPETATDTAEGAQEEGTQQRPWWRRIFEG
jgi:predicted ArsR family transcriptional regulator